MHDKITCDSIVSWLQSQIEQKLPISPHVWVESAEKLNVLVADESDKLYDLAQKVAQTKVEYITSKMSVSEAKARVEATDEYREMCKQKAKIERIFEHIRLAKIRARATQDEIRGNY